MKKVKWLTRRGLVIAVFGGLLLTAAGVQAKTQGVTKHIRPLPPGPPHYINRYGYILPFSENSYVKFSGSARVAYLWDKNYEFTNRAGDSYYETRIQGNADFHLMNDALRFYLEVGDTEAYSMDRSPTFIDQSNWEINQAFLDVAMPAFLGNGYLRLGRQQLSLDRDLWTTVRLGANVESYYDGVRLHYQADGNTSVDAFVVKPLDYEVGSFNDDAAHHSGAFYGLYVKRDWADDLSQDFFALGRYGTLAPPIGPLGRVYGPPGKDKRLGLGTRVYGEIGNVSYNVDLMYQFGTHDTSFGSKDIRAWGTVDRVGYTFAHVVGKPYVGVLLAAGSGDHDPSDSRLGTFYPFQMGYGKQFGPGNYTSVANRVVFGPEFEVHPSPKWRVRANVYGNWRIEKNDCVYVVPTKRVSATCGKSGDNYIGTTVGASVRYVFNEHLYVDALYTYFNTDGVLEDSGGQDSQYFTTRIYFMF